MSVGIDTSAPGVKSGTVAINVISDGAGTSGLGTTPLPTQTVAVTGSVFSGNGYWTGGDGSSTSWGAGAATANWTDENGVAAAPGTWSPNYSDSATFDNRAGNNTAVTLDGASPTLSVMTFNTTTGRSYDLEQGSGGTLIWATALPGGGQRAQRHAYVRHPGASGQQRVVQPAAGHGADRFGQHRRRRGRLGPCAEWSRHARLER